MNKSNSLSLRAQTGFTLVELLVVIAIIGILASILLPALRAIKVKEQKVRARRQMAEIVFAINKYESDYNHFPMASTARNSVVSSGDDFTYGGTFTGSGNFPYDVKAPGGYTANNSEVMAVLLNLERFSGGAVTVNAGHVLNTGTALLNPLMTGDATQPGVGPDGVYRDPWGNPYVITIDANNDEKTRDAFYGLSAVSQDPANPNGGLDGLIKRTLPNGTTVFEVNSPATVWSAGPDKKIDQTAPANKGANKDNVVSWK